jgi:hypothetical protein
MWVAVPFIVRMLRIMRQEGSCWVRDWEGHFDVGGPKILEGTVERFRMSEYG